MLICFLRLSTIYRVSMQAGIYMCCKLFGVSGRPKLQIHNWAGDLVRAEGIYNGLRYHEVPMFVRI